MYTCKQCGKTYQTQSSLSRHLRNHSVDHSPHSCSTCGVVFSRRDLLIRHSTIHGNPDRSCEREKSRRRCHTACQSCRTARVKCNGEQPCRTCAVNGRHCRYTTRSHRVSHVAGASISSYMPCTRPEGPQEGVNTPTPAEIVPAPAGDPLQPLSVAQLPAPEASDILSGGPQDLAVLSGETPLDDLDFSWSAPGAISWPWLHENLYLQGDPWDEWFGAVNPSGGEVSAAEERIDPYLTADQVIDMHLPTTSKQLPPPVLPRPQETRATTPRSPPMGPPQQQDGSQPLRTGRCTRTAAQERVVGELVAYATQPAMESSDARLCYWYSRSLQAAQAFDIGDWKSTNTEPVLVRMLGFYKQHFSPLWPLLSGQEFSPADIHPLLFLTLVSIGAMYGSRQECLFGTSLHEAIRPVLVTPLSSLEDTEENFMPLARARLLIQVAALYFGQRRAFSYAQHLGAVLIAQARRMDLFTTNRLAFAISRQRGESISAWRRLEARKRLAFGILRVDVFTSVLMNSRPLLSAEEIDLTLPAPDQIWNTEKPAPDSRVTPHGEDTDIDQGQRLPFCDLVRIALDRGEALLEMDPIGYELLLFGLQGGVWRFSHDPHLFCRLTGTHETSTMEAITGMHPGRRSLSQPSPQIDRLGTIARQMNDLRDNRRQLVEALTKWEKSFAAVRTTGRCANDRTSTMSSLLLFYLSRLRLSAPVAELHNIAYAVSSRSPIENRQLYTLSSWARSREGSIAADVACQIFSLLRDETTRPVEARAKHNLLAFSGLHHAAVVLWAFAGCQSEGSSGVSLPSATDGEPISLCRRQSGRLMGNIVDLYKSLNPVQWCSFASAAENLSSFPFPVSDSPGTTACAYAGEC